MRMVGTCSRGIRIPIISKGDDLCRIVVDSVMTAAESDGFQIKDKDVIGITEAVVAKAEGNYAAYSDIGEDVREKFPGGEIGLLFPILSRNRFLNILKGISKGANKVFVLMSYPQDEVGNPIMDASKTDPDCIENRLYSEEEFREINGNFLHPFTGIDYISLYREAGINIEVYFSKDPSDILKLTKNVLIGGIHNRFRLKEKLLREGAESVYLLSDILSEPKAGRGHNEKYGVLGSNISTEETIKLFPNRSEELVANVRKLIEEKTGKRVEVLVYGDGAFKDPVCGIWELADPVVSPAFTDGLLGTPNEIKLKYVADNKFGHLDKHEQQNAVFEFIKSGPKDVMDVKEGTTPRKYADLLGSLCDLMSGSGDKGTPVIHIQGYFDNYSDL